MNRRAWGILSISTLAALLLSFSAVWAEVRIGVLANNGIENCLRQWSATASYLEREIPDYKFKIIPVPFEQLEPLTAANALDFIIANPLNYVELNYRFNVTHLASLRRQEAGQDVTMFGGVIFYRANRKDINDLTDLRGKLLAAADDSSLGGYLSALGVLHDLGLTPKRDFQVTFSGSHEAVVYDVLNGKADMGTARTGTLERMRAKGQIKLEELKIIPAPPNVGKLAFPGFLSTPLYPEWPIIKLRPSSPELARLVTSKLLEMRPEEEAARDAGISGWDVSLAYETVRQLMMKLEIGPYSGLRKITLWQAAGQHWQVVSLTAVLILSLAGLLLYVRHIYANLDKYKTSLENELKSKAKIEAELRASKDSIQQIFDTAAGGMRVIGPDGKVLMANKAYLELSQSMRDEALGSACSLCFGGPACGTSDCTLYRLSQGENRVEYELEKRRSDGTKVLCHLTATPLRSPNGDFLGIVEDFRDITERQAILQALSRAEEKYRQIFENAPLGIFQSVPDGRYLSVNQRMVSMHGYDSVKQMLSEVTDIGAQNYVNPADREKIVRQMANSDELIAYQIERKRRDGTSFWASLDLRVERDENGQAIRADGFLTDISDRLAVEKALSESEHMHRLVFENSPHGMVHISSNGKILNYNKKFLDTLGLHKEMLSRFDTLERAPKEINQAVNQAIQGHPSVFEGRPSSPNGRSYGILRVVFNPVDSEHLPCEVIASVEDVTLEREKDEELRRLWSTIEHCPASIVITDASGTILYVNPYFTQTTGYEPEEVLGQNPRILKSGLHPPEFYLKMWAELMAGNTWRGEFCNRNKIGDFYWEDATISPVRDSSGKISHFIAVKEDVTERKRRDAELQTALAEYEAIFDNSSVGIMHIVEGRIIARVNRRIVEMSGFSEADLVGKNTRMFYTSEEDFLKFETYYIDILRQGQVVCGEQCFSRKDGGIIWCTLYAKAIHPGNIGAGVIWVVVDISDRKELESLREDVERIMRHNLKSPLNGIINLPGIIAEEGNLNNMQLEMLTDIEDAGRRILSQINTSLDLYKIETGVFEFEPLPVDLEPLVRIVREELGSEIRHKKLSVQSSLQKSGPKALASEQLCLSILENLVKNAIEASPLGAVVGINLSINERHICLAISNQGEVPLSIRSNFFGKYVTSHKRGGTGLGTYSASLMAKVQSGSLNLDCSKPGYTTLTLCLPKA